MKQILFLICFFIAGFSQASDTVDHVVIVSLDGGGSVVLEGSASKEVGDLVSNGAFTFRAKTISPSVTLPSHTSMTTGVTPDVHGITWNTWKPKEGAVKVPTIFSMAKSEGFSTALFASKDKFKHLLTEDTFDNFTITDTDAVGISKVASEYFLKNSPSLMFVHLPDLDAKGHKNGWGSKEQRAAIKNIDVALAELKKAIVEGSGSGSFLLIVTADHGGTKKAHSNAQIANNSEIPWVAWGTKVSKGLEIPEEVSTVDTAVTALSALGISNSQNMSGKSLLPYIFK